MFLHPPTLLVFAGLPGTGKTAISRELTKRLGATYIRIDTIEQNLRPAGVLVGETGYAIANALAAENLRLGRIVIADCVNPVIATRNGWRCRHENVSTHHSSTGSIDHLVERVEACMFGVST